MEHDIGNAVGWYVERSDFEVSCLCDSCCVDVYGKGHPWILDDNIAPDKPLASTVLSCLKQFSAMNKLKKMALHIWIGCLTSRFFASKVFLVGLPLSFVVIRSVNQPRSIWDLVTIVVCIFDIVIAYITNTQLYNFVSRNNELKELN